MADKNFESAFNEYLELTGKKASDFETMDFDQKGEFMDKFVAWSADKGYSLNNWRKSEPKALGEGQKSLGMGETQPIAPKDMHPAKNGMFPAVKDNDEMKIIPNKIPAKVKPKGIDKSLAEDTVFEEMTTEPKALAAPEKQGEKPLEQKEVDRKARWEKHAAHTERDCTHEADKEGLVLRLTPKGKEASKDDTYVQYVGDNVSFRSKKQEDFSKLVQIEKDRGQDTIAIGKGSDEFKAKMIIACVSNGMAYEGASFEGLQVSDELKQSYAKAMQTAEKMAKVRDLVEKKQGGKASDEDYTKALGKTKDQRDTGKADIRAAIVAKKANTK